MFGQNYLKFILLVCYSSFVSSFFSMESQICNFKDSFLSGSRTRPCLIHLVNKSQIATLIRRYLVKIPSVSFKQNIFCRFTKRNAITCKVDKQSGETFCLCTDQNKFYPKIKLFQHFRFGLFF